MKCEFCGFAGCPKCLTEDERSLVNFVMYGHVYVISKYRKAHLDARLAALRVGTIKGKAFVTVTSDLGGLEKTATRTVEVPLYDWLVQQGAEYVGLASELGMSE